MVEVFNPNEYSKQLSHGFIFHAISSIALLGASIICVYNNMFASSLFSDTFENKLQDDPELGKKFNISAYSIYGLVVAIFGLYNAHILAVSCILQRNLTQRTDAAEQESNRIDEKYTPILSTLISRFAEVLKVPEPIVYSIALDNSIEVHTALFRSGICPTGVNYKKGIVFHAGFLKLVEANKASLEITLAHELIHLKRDWNISILVALIYWLTEKLLRLYQLPMQCAYFIAGSIIFGFQSAFAYSAGIAFVLTVINGFARPHRLRLMESRADFESLFSAVQFSQGEYEKRIAFFNHCKESEKQLTGLTRFMFKYIDTQTHPPHQDRILMTHAAESLSRLPML